MQGRPHERLKAEAVARAVDLEQQIRPGFPHPRQEHVQQRRLRPGGQQRQPARPVPLQARRAQIVRFTLVRGPAGGHPAVRPKGQYPDIEYRIQ